MMHFSLFQISPYFRTISQTPSNIFPIFHSPTTFFNFHPSKNFSSPFFSHRLQILNFPPIFAFSVRFPIFWRNYYFPLHRFFPLLWPWCTYMPHTMHVLDAPDLTLCGHTLLAMSPYNDYKFMKPWAKATVAKLIAVHVHGIFPLNGIRLSPKANRMGFVCLCSSQVTLFSPSRNLTHKLKIYTGSQTRNCRYQLIRSSLLKSKSIDRRSRSGESVRLRWMVH